MLYYFLTLVNPAPRYLSGLLKSGLKKENWVEGPRWVTVPGDIMLSSLLAVRTLNACVQGPEPLCRVPMIVRAFHQKVHCISIIILMQEN